ncbi:MAG: hypothetical protein AAF849_10575 [Bacteroidota bacterium]
MKKKVLLARIQQITWIALLVAVGMLVLSAVGKRQNSRSMPLLDIEIQPTANADSNLITDEEIDSILRNSFTYGITDNPIKTIDVGRAERVLEKNPFVKNADVYIDNTNTINVEVEQREPVVRIIDGEGRNYYLDKAANYMPLSEHHTARVLVLTGFIQPHEPNFMKLKQHRLKDLFYLSERIRADEFFHHLIEQVHLSQNGDILFVPKIGKQQILFGKYLDEDNVEEKLQRLKIFYKEALSRTSWTKYQLIDIRFKDQIVCKK